MLTVPIELGPPVIFLIRKITISSIVIGSKNLFYFRTFFSEVVVLMISNGNRTERQSQTDVKRKRSNWVKVTATQLSSTTQQCAIVKCRLAKKSFKKSFLAVSRPLRHYSMEGQSMIYLASMLIKLSQSFPPLSTTEINLR